MKLIYRVSPTQRLIFTEDAVHQMQGHAQRSMGEAEAGGVLLGRHLLDSDDLVVDEVTLPQPADKRARTRFFRSNQHSEVAQARWRASQGTSAYLGLWHTHPEADPSPSSVDLRDWEKAVAFDTFEGNRLFFPIVGIERIRVWTKSRTGPVEELYESRSEEDG